MRDTTLCGAHPTCASPQNDGPRTILGNCADCQAVINNAAADAELVANIEWDRTCEWPRDSWQGRVVEVVEWDMSGAWGDEAWK